MRGVALFDTAAGLYHLRARQYDPSVGRFVQLDPRAQTITDPYVASYVYVNDQPTVLIDPSGREAEGFQFAQAWWCQLYLLHPCPSSEEIINDLTEPWWCDLYVFSKCPTPEEIWDDVKDLVGRAITIFSGTGRTVLRWIQDLSPEITTFSRAFLCTRFQVAC